MTDRMLLWFETLEKEGKSTENIRRLFANKVSLSKDLSEKRGYGGGSSTSGGNGYGDATINQLWRKS